VCARGLCVCAHLAWVTWPQPCVRSDGNDLHTLRSSQHLGFVCARESTNRESSVLTMSHAGVMLSDTHAPKLLKQTWADDKSSRPGLHVHVEHAGVKREAQVCVY
jgi:hypothetical protein